jgi:hypothetical protein
LNALQNCRKREEDPGFAEVPSRHLVNRERPAHSPEQHR